MKKRILFLGQTLFLSLGLIGCSLFEKKYTTTSGGDGNQNFIYDSDGKLIEGTVSLFLENTAKSTEKLEEYSEGKTLSLEDKEVMTCTTAVLTAKKTL